MSGEHARAFRILFVGLVCIGMGQSMLFSLAGACGRSAHERPARTGVPRLIAGRISVRKPGP